MRAAPLPGRWDGLVMLCAGTSWDGIWFPDKHIAQRLTSYAPVLYVDPPISPLTPRRQPHLAASMREPRLRLLRPNLARLTPVVLPGMRRRGMHRVTEVLTRRALRGAVAALGGSVRALVLATPDVLFGAAGEQVKVVYATDDFVAGSALMGMDGADVRRNEVRQAAEADVVVAVSPALVDKWRALGHEPAFVPNGVDDERFAGTDDAPIPADVGLPPPIAGFIGHLSERIDVPMLEAVAARGRSLLLVGPRQPTFELDRIRRLLSLPNVSWVGPKPFEQLPSYLRVMHVGLTPYADTPFNRASFPLKTLEYLAAGRGAVASDLPSTRWLATDLVRVASADAFADAVDEALSEPRSDDLVRRRRELARRHGWARRTADFARALALDVETVAEVRR